MSGLAALRAAPGEPGRIHQVGFGWINVGGRFYEQDRILHADGVSPPWWRDRRHWFGRAEVPEFLASFHPRRVLLGTGWMGMLRVEEGVAGLFAEAGVGFTVMRTPEAVRTWQHLALREPGVVALLHLTC